MAVNINKLGIRVDGWADLVEGAGEKEDLARQQLEQIVRAKNLPNTSTNPTFVSPTYGNKQRKYVVVEMANGATVAAYIGAFGNDLYAKWDIFVRSLLNMTVIYVLLAIGAFFGLSGGFGGRYGFSFFGLVAGFIGWVIGGAILVAIAGFVMRRNPLAFFFKQLDEFDLDDIGALTLATHKSVLHALDAVGIQTQTLRIKEQFAAGSRDRLI